MASIRVKNWDEFQHYKDRSPPWIKLHRGLIDNYDFFLLSPLAGKCLPLIWLIASESDGVLPEMQGLAFRLRIGMDEAESIADELTERGFLTIGDVAETAEQFSTTAQRVAKANGYGTRHVSDATKRKVWARDGGKCTACGSDELIEYDHITPVSRGGCSTVDNLQLLCRSCNRRKRKSLATPAQPLRSLETEAERETEEDIEPKGSLSDSSESNPKPKRNPIPYEKIVELYHTHLPKSPRVEILNTKRKGQVSARWCSGELDTLESWEAFFQYCSQSKFLIGATDPAPGRNRFIADLEWLTKESNYTKIVEGKYHNG